MAYTALNGTVITVEGFAVVRAKIAIITIAMLNDICALEKYPDLFPLLAHQNGIATQDYSRSFKYGMQQIGISPGFCIDDVFFALEPYQEVNMNQTIQSMDTTSQSIRDILVRLKRNTIYPMSKVSTDFLRANYYLCIWKMQLEALYNLANQTD